MKHTAIHTFGKMKIDFLFARFGKHGVYHPSIYFTRKVAEMDRFMDYLETTSTESHEFMEALGLA